MGILTSVAMRLFWWVLPKLLSKIVDRIGDALQIVETANSLEDSAEKRAYTLRMLTIWGIDVPDWLARGLLEFIVILNKLGVRAEHLDRMEEIISGDMKRDCVDAVNFLLSDETARNAVINRFITLFPEIPERVGRLLFELAAAKMTNAK